jgi:hypothetical protein
MKCLVLMVGLSCFLALSVHAEWFFEVGPLYRSSMDVSVCGGSQAANDGASAASSGTTGGMPSLSEGPLNDDGTAQILREFDDGYVGPSGWEWANNDGVTQYFAYDEPGQYDADANTLTYQLTLGRESVSQTSTKTSTISELIAWGERRKTDGWGIMATIGHGWRKEKSWSLGGQLRLGWLSGIQADFRDHPAFRQSIDRSTFETTVWREDTLIYTYDTLGNPAFPLAPYEMNDPSAVGPLIADTPSAITQSPPMGGTSTRQIDRFSDTAVSSVDLGIKAQAFTLQLGPRIMWHSGKRISLLLQPALTVNLLDVDMHRTETFRHPSGTVLSSWYDKSDKQAWRMGAGVQAGVQVALSELWNLTASGGYEWVDKYSLSTNLDRVHVDLSGYQLELAVGRHF